MRELPEASTQGGHDFLANLRSLWNVSGPQQGGYFEEGNWTQSLAQVLIRVGKEVFRSDSKVQAMR